MKKNQNNFPLHTHFIGVPVTDELETVVMDCREWMNGNYGCKSGYGTPPHITLLSPFSLPDGFSDKDVLDATKRAIDECKNQGAFPLNVNVSGFGSFSERTIFANVQDSEQWQKAHLIFMKIFSNEILSSQKKDTRRFYPHLSIANRDIPSGTIGEALNHFSELNLSENFVANKVCIFTRTPTGGWCDAYDVE